MLSSVDESSRAPSPGAGRCLLLGPLAAAAGWAVILSAWAVNRGWFSPLSGAFSDLGSGRACCPWLFNLGLVAVAVLLAGFAWCILRLARGASRRAAGLALLASGLLLAFVGVFPEETGLPHAASAVGFFALADLGLVLAGLAAPGRAGLAASAVAGLLFPVALAVQVLHGWPSTALLEAYAILVIDAALLLAYTAYRGGR